MNLSRSDQSYVQTRWFQEIFLDKLDFLYRLASRQQFLPPYSLRTLVGGAKGFRQVGPWFLNEFLRLGLFCEDCRILDVGCGCRRLAYTFSRDAQLERLNVRYAGMDIDRKAVVWFFTHLVAEDLRHYLGEIVSSAG